MSEEEKQKKINEIIEELRSCKKRKIKTSYILEKLEPLWEPTSLDMILCEALLNHH